MIFKFKKGTQLYDKVTASNIDYPIALNQKLEENVKIDVPVTRTVTTSCGTQEYTIDKHTLVFYKKQDTQSLYLKCGDATNWPTTTITNNDIPKKYIISAVILLITIISIIIYKHKHK